VAHDLAMAVSRIVCWDVHAQHEGAPACVRANNIAAAGPRIDKETNEMKESYRDSNVDSTPCSSQAQYAST